MLPLQIHFSISFQLWNEYYNYRRGHHGYTAMIYVTRPKATGTIRLKSKDPMVYPEIDPKYNVDDDVNRLVEGMYRIYIIKNEKWGSTCAYVRTCA
jgi:choline dehydrogenase-like flavoprotein